MNFKHRNTFIFLWTFLPFGLALITCGPLTVEYVNNAISTDCKIRLYPSYEMHSYITKSNQYRWIHTKNSTPHVILQKNAGTYNMSKYGEENFTLLIRHLVHSDEGRYRVHCWTDNRVNYFSPEVNVKVPRDIPSTPEQHVPTPSDARIGTTSLIVISLCAVVIVAITAGTIFLIVRKRTNRQEGVTPLVDKKETSGRTRSSKNEESVYNEIDIGTMAVDDAKLDERTFVHATEALMHSSQETRALPPRPNNSTYDILDNDYDLVNDTDAFYKESDIPGAEYVEKVEQSPANVEQTPSIDSAAVSETNADGKTEGKTSNKHETARGINETIVTDVKDDIFPEYAKVLKRKPANITTENGSVNSVKRNEYKITFPKINCSEITHTLGEGFQRQVLSGCGEPVMYSNLVSRSQRIKSRQGRASRKSLQYAVLDLVEPETDHVTHAEESVDLFNKLQTCQYDSIDFDQKAFVAPVRKAPSSWYKRRNKKGKRK